MAEQLQRLNEIFRHVFNNEQLTVSRETTAADVAGWDSLMHVNLIIKVERKLGVRFRSSEVAGLKNVGELVDLMDRYQSASASR